MLLPGQLTSWEVGIRTGLLPSESPDSSEVTLRLQLSLDLGSSSNYYRELLWRPGRQPDQAQGHFQTWGRGRGGNAVTRGEMSSA